MKNVIIVGSGLSGLAAALNLCNNGIKPIIFEKNAFHGGYATNVRRNGFRFEMSLHFVGPTFFKSLDELGIRDEIQMIDVKDTTRVECTKSCIASQYSYNDKGVTYKKYLMEKYPDEKEGIEKIFTYGSNTEKITDDLLLGKHPFVAMLQHPNSIPFFAKYMKKTAAELLDELFKNEDIKKEISTLAILLGTPNESLSAVPLVQLATESYNRGAFYIKGGSQRLVDVMRSRIEKSGGNFFFNAPVTKFNVENDRIKNIVAGKKIIEVENILYCCDVLNLQNKFAKGISVFKKNLNSLPVAYSLFVYHLGLDVDIKNKFGIDRAEYNFKTDKTTFSVAVYSNKDPTCCKKGTSILTISIVESKINEKLIMQELERAWPGISSHVIEKMILTPKDYENLTWNTGGSFGGFQVTKDALASPIPHETLIKNLFVAGQWVGSGAGYINTIVGGIKASKLLIERNT